jgi:hypothetical protein
MSTIRERYQINEYMKRMLNNLQGVVVSLRNKQLRGC